MCKIKIVLIRHGESEGNVDRTAFIKIPDKNHSLTPKGVFQADLSTVKLYSVFNKCPVKVFCSPHNRTQQTLKEIKNSRMLNIKETILDDDLREQIWGEFENMDEYHEAFHGYKSDPYNYVFPRGGESGQSAFNRAKNFVEKLRQEYKQNILVVSHGVLIRFIVAAINNISLDDVRKLRIIDNCDVVEIEKNNDDFHISTDMIWKGEAV